MKRLLIVLLGMLAFQANVWAARCDEMTAKVLAPGAGSVLIKGAPFVVQWQDLDVCLGDSVTIEVTKEDGGRAPWFKKIKKIDNYGFYSIEASAIDAKNLKIKYRFQIKSKKRRCKGKFCAIQSELFAIAKFRQNTKNEIKEQVGRRIEANVSTTTTEDAINRDTLLRITMLEQRLADLEGATVGGGGDAVRVVSAPVAKPVVKPVDKPDLIVELKPEPSPKSKEVGDENATGAGGASLVEVDDGLPDGTPWREVVDQNRETEHTLCYDEDDIYGGGWVAGPNYCEPNTDCEDLIRRIERAEQYEERAARESGYGDAWRREIDRVIELRTSFNEEYVEETQYCRGDWLRGGINNDCLHDIDGVWKEGMRWRTCIGVKWNVANGHDYETNPVCWSASAGRWWVRGARLEGVAWDTGENPWVVGKPITTATHGTVYDEQKSHYDCRTKCASYGDPEGIAWCNWSGYHHRNEAQQVTCEYQGETIPLGSHTEAQTHARHESSACSFRHISFKPRLTSQ